MAVLCGWGLAWLKIEDQVAEGRDKRRKKVGGKTTLEREVGQLEFNVTPREMLLRVAVSRG